MIAPGLTVLFCGINPGLYTAAIGHHFGRPGNRFWPRALPGGFTPRLFDPSEKEKLLELGYGITNLVSRATLRADELTAKELVAGGEGRDREGAQVQAALSGGGGDQFVSGRLRPPESRRRSATRNHRQIETLGAPQPEWPQRPLPSQGVGGGVWKAEGGDGVLVRTTS